MMPERSNYEIWLADWLDGKLSGEQNDLFRKFLADNPDLKDEAESLTLTKLSPDNYSYPGKDLLKRRSAELHPYQIEYLSAAYFENDISQDQLDDLNRNIEHNPESKELFEALRRIKLLPPQHKYMYKSRLKKQPTGAKIIRLSAIGLSAAATIALLIFSSIFMPRFITERRERTAQNVIQESEPFVVRTEIFRARGEEVFIPEENVISSMNEELSVHRNDPPFLPGAIDSNIIADNYEIKRETADFRITSLPAFNIDLLKEPYDHSLIVSTIEFKKPLNEDERNRLSIFLARTFREKILREETGSDTPVKSYEIASAGIKGLNKLFGWDMALVRINDADGELKSIYFSSKLLKVNAPVRKEETAQ